MDKKRRGPQIDQTGNTRTLQVSKFALEALGVSRVQHADKRLLMGDRWPLLWESLSMGHQGLLLGPAHVRQTVEKLAKRGFPGGSHHRT